MQLLAYKFVPGRCRLCGRLPDVRGEWVICRDAHCRLSTFRSRATLWPRRRVIDWHATLALWGGTAWQGAALLTVLAIFGALFILAGCGARAEVTNKNQTIECHDTRDGEVFSYNTNDVKDCVIVFGGNSHCSVTDSAGKERQIVAGMEAYLKCERAILSADTEVKNANPR